MTKLPLQITFRQMAPSAALESRIRELAGKLEQFSKQILRCHVIVQAPHRRHHQGTLFDFHIDLTVPDGQIAVRRAHPTDQAHEDPYVALRDAFRAVRRRLQDYERKRRRDIKTHNGASRGRVCELHPERDFGCIETEDGRVIYFHRNSLINARFDSLTAGDQVCFVEETGDAGPQASTVRVV